MSRATNTDLENKLERAFEFMQLTTSMINDIKSSSSRARPSSKSRTSRVVTFDSGEEEENTSDSEAAADAYSKTRLRSSRAKSSSDYFTRYADSYISFTARNPTTYHVVRFFSEILEQNGFKYLSEKQSWGKLKPGLYYTTRSGTNLGAFAIGPDWTPESGTGVIGSHIDALAAKLKPVSKKTSIDGYELLGVAPYAGGLSPVWFDRDLGLGGRVLIKKSGKIITKLVDSSPKPIARISTLAPHFGEVADGPLDKETRAVPVIGYGFDGEEPPTESEKESPLVGKHPISLLRYIAELAEVEVKDLVQLDLDLFDVQRGIIGGLKDDFIYAPRIDDRLCSFAALSALIEFTKNGDLPSRSFNQVLLYDNEEIGSLTRQGAKSTLVNSIVERVVEGYLGSDLKESIETTSRVVFANSIVLSADVTHLLNPTYKNEYLEHHYPVPNKGVTIALDPNGHMATDTVGLALIEAIAKLNEDEVQYFQIKNGERSGGTIGPSISSATGARTIDLGIAQLSMHSIRAATGVKDVGLGVKFFKGFFTNWRETYDSFGDL